MAPETRIDPPQVTLHFLVSADGRADQTNQAAVVQAWVRALPGQQIHVTGSLAQLTGPGGAVPASAVRWTGSAVSATGGAQAAACSSGVFSSTEPHEMVDGWARSGKLTCAETFELTGAGDLAPGTYTGVVTLAATSR